MTDLYVGLGLLVIVPFVTYVACGVLGVIPEGPEATMGRERKVEPLPITAEEIDLRIKKATIIIRQNAKEFIQKMDTVEDDILRDDYRRWADRALTAGLELLAEVDSKTSSGQFPAQRARAQTLRAEAKTNLKRVQALDVLGGN